MLFRLPSEEELTDNKLNEFIAKHNAECAFRFKHLKDAYETDYQIFHQKPKPDYKPDNRIAVNFAKYMVDTFNGYFIGNPIKISVDGDAAGNIKKYVELLDQYNDQDDNNAELSKICCIYGKGYEMYYVDELGNIGITYLTPFDAFMIYDDSVLCRERYFVRLYIDSNEIKISGHANYAVFGSDIVCAGVTALAQTLIKSIKDLTDDKIEYEISPGRVDIKYGNLSEKSKTLVDSFFIGICMIAEEFPEYVRIM